MALSQWDQQFLPADQQAEIQNLTNQWETADAATRKSLNTRAEQIRQQFGYTGGVDGSQYNPTGLPVAPQTPTFNDPYAGMGQQFMEDYMNTPEYDSPYEDMITDTLSRLQQRSFDYDPATDPAYQAFKERAYAAGDKAYEDNLGGMSAMTGGRPNTWAGTVASQARNQYVLQAEMAVIDFEDRAYGRFRDETNDLYNFLNIIDSMDTKAYNQYRDSKNDKKEMFNMVMDLSDQEFRKYEFMVDQTWKQFDAETELFDTALRQKESQIAQALDRTNMLGYVDNEAALTLGIPAGTKSQAARERAEQMEDYITKQALDLEQFKKEQQVKMQYDKEMIRYGNSFRSVGGSGGSGGSGGNVDENGNVIFAPSKSEADHITKQVDIVTSFMGSREFGKIEGRDAKHEAVARTVERIVKDATTGMWGDNSIEIGNAIFERLEADPLYNQYYTNYVYTDELKDSFDYYTQPGGTIKAIEELGGLRR